MTSSPSSASDSLSCDATTLPYRESSLSSSSSSSPSPSSNSSAPAKPAFLFIDSQADNAQNPTVGKQKQAFLQRKFHQKKKQESIDRLKSFKSSSKQNPLSLQYASENQVQIADSWGASKAGDGVSKRVATMSEMWSLKAYLSQGYVDPFASSAVKMSDSMNLYFHHFRIHTIASCYPLDSTRMSIWWWQKAITQPALLQALLFLTAGHHAVLESNNGVSSQAIQKSVKDSLHLRGNTLKTLNDILQDPMKAVAESTTLVVASLVAIEAVDANFDALEAHSKGLKRLIHLVGGLEVLDHMTLSKIYQSDVKSAALKNSRPSFPMLDRWRSEILQESKVFHPGSNLEVPGDLSSLGVRFFKASWYKELDSSMQTFIQILRRLILYFEVAQLRPSIVMPTDNDLFLVFEHQLLSTSYSADTDGLHEPLRLSLLIYLNLRIWHFQTFPFMQYMVDALRQSLIPQLARFKTDAPDLLFWVLFIGGMASQGYKSHPFFVSRLTDMAHSLGLDEWTKARPVLGGFFYTHQPGERGAENLWNEVLLMESYPYIAPKSTLQVVTV